jgi:hypothetical protein
LSATVDSSVVIGATAAAAAELAWLKRTYGCNALMRRNMIELETVGCGVVQV